MLHHCRIRWLAHADEAEAVDPQEIERFMLSQSDIVDKSQRFENFWLERFIAVAAEGGEGREAGIRGAVLVQCPLFPGGHRLVFEGDARGESDEAIVVPKVRPDLIHDLGVGRRQSEGFQIVAQRSLLGHLRSFRRSGGFGSNVGHTIQARLGFAAAGREIHGTILRMNDGIREGQRFSGDKRFLFA